MEHQENAENASEALHATSYMGHPHSVELSQVQQTKPAAMSKVPCARCGTQGHFAGECPSRPPLEHHQSQAAVLAAAAAAAAGLPLQVQQSVHNSFFNTNTSDPTYAALKGLTEASGSAGKPVSAAVYGALASQVYGAVADQVLSQGTDDPGYPAAGEAPSATTAMNPAYGTNSSQYTGPAYGTMGGGGGEADPQAVFEAARQRFIEQGQQVLAEQQAIRSDRDRSPVRRSALLPDPVPQPISAARPKRRALLPTPPGGPELPAIKEGDPIARCYAEYLQQYQQYQHYHQYHQYQQYQYYYPPPPPPPPPQMPTMPMPPSGPMDASHLAAPGTGTSPRAYEPPPPHKDPHLRNPDYSYHHMPEPTYR